MSTITQPTPTSAVDAEEARSTPQRRPRQANLPIDLSEAVRSAPGTPTWEVARFFPRQGEWTEAAYLALETNHLIELNHGMLEFLPMPTYSHAFVVRFLFRLLDDLVQQQKLGQALFAPARVRISDEVQREPDVLYIPKSGKIEKMYTEDAALVIEVVSEGQDNRKRDLVEKRADYASAGIPEYWIVDPETTTVSVLTLRAGSKEYTVHGEFKPGDTATSVLLQGFTVNVTDCFAAGEVAEGD